MINRRIFKSLIAAFLLISFTKAAYEIISNQYCPVGTYYLDDMKRCENCDPGCICSSGTNLCDSCLPGRMLVKIGTKTACYHFENLDQAVYDCEAYQIDTSLKTIVCTKCTVGVLLAGVCRFEQKLNGCSEQDTTTKNCITPKKGYFLDPATFACTPCSNYNSEQCTSTCASVADKDKCTACSDGYFLLPVNSGITDGCGICPSGCKTCTLTNKVLSCSVCNSGFYLDSGNCVSCEREFGNRCNDCNKNYCIQYQTSGTPRCLPCPSPFVCSSSTVFTSCTSGSFLLITMPSGITMNKCFPASNFDEKATKINPSDRTLISCKAGYLPNLQKCYPIQITTVSGCVEGCTNCVETLVTPANPSATPPTVAVYQYDCFACESIKYMYDNNGQCIKCKLSGEEQAADQVFFLDLTQCYSVFTTPIVEPNCLIQAGLDFGGVCKICSFGYKLVGTQCNSCNSFTSTSTSITVTYGCQTPTAIVTLNYPAYDPTMPSDPYTQPTFYSMFLGIPLSQIDKEKIDSLEKPTLDFASSPTNDEDKKTSSNQNTTDTENNQQNETKSNGFIILISINFFILFFM